MSKRAISFTVLILSLVITNQDIPRPFRHFWVFLFFFFFFFFFLSGTVKYFCFTVLPFGLSSAPYTFIKCLRPLVKFWRFNGVKIVVFLDDRCGKGESLQTAKGHSLFVQTSLSNAGFVSNSNKTLWEPTQLLGWLGLNWNLVCGLIFITDRRRTYCSYWRQIPSIGSVRYGSGLGLNWRPYKVHVSSLR